jgi:hypothetical protein
MIQPRNKRHGGGGRVGSSSFHLISSTAAFFFLGAINASVRSLLKQLHYYIHLTSHAQFVTLRGTGSRKSKIFFFFFFFLFIYLFFKLHLTYMNCYHFTITLIIFF